MLKNYSKETMQIAYETYQAYPGQKLQMIKVVRQRTGLNLQDTRDLIDDVEKNLDSYKSLFGQSDFNLDDQILFNLNNQ